MTGEVYLNRKGAAHNENIQWCAAPFFIYIKNIVTPSGEEGPV